MLRPALPLLAALALGCETAPSRGAPFVYAGVLRADGRAVVSGSQGLYASTGDGVRALSSQSFFAALDARGALRWQRLAGDGGSVLSVASQGEHAVGVSLEDDGVARLWWVTDAGDARATDLTLVRAPSTARVAADAGGLYLATVTLSPRSQTLARLEADGTARWSWALADGDNVVAPVPLRDGGVALVGNLRVGAAWQVRVVTFSPEGQVLRARGYGLSGGLMAMDATATADGGVLLAATNFAPGNAYDHDLVLAWLDPQGAVLRARRLSRHTPSHEHRVPSGLAAAVHSDADGRVLIATGIHAAGTDTADLALVELGPDGVSRAQYALHPGRFAAPLDVTLTPEGPRVLAYVNGGAAMVMAWTFPLHGPPCRGTTWDPALPITDASLTAEDLSVTAVPLPITARALNPVGRAPDPPFAVSSCGG